MDCKRAAECGGVCAALDGTAEKLRGAVGTVRTALEQLTGPLDALAASTYAVRAKTLHWNEAASMALTIFPASAAHSPIRSTAWESSSCRRPQSVRRSRSASAAPLTS